MPRARPPLVAAVLAAAVLAAAVPAAGCGGSGGTTTGATSAAPAASVPAAVGTDFRLELARAANDLAEYCLRKSEGRTSRINPKDAVDRLLAAYRASGGDASVREALQQLGATLGRCYGPGADRVNSALGTAP